MRKYSKSLLIITFFSLIVAGYSLRNNMKSLISYFHNKSEIRYALSKLPTGDVNSQKCKELIESAKLDLQVSMSISDRMSTNSEKKEDRDSYAVQSFRVNASKYVYSKKLCLAYETFNQYNPLIKLNISTSTGMAYANQIVDLGSNQIVAEYGTSDFAGDKSYIYSKEQKYIFDIDDFWSEIMQMK